MANVGILTMNLGENMGGILQAYALYKEIENLGHTPILFRINKDTSVLKSLLRRVLVHNPLPCIYDYNGIRRRFINARPMRNFVDRAFICQTKVISSEDEFIAVGNSLDAIIVGSDQVWRYAYVGDRIEKYFLKGIGDLTRKIAYAASFGVSEWECQNEKLNKELEELLKKFDYVSVREQSGLDILQNTFHYSSGSVSLDPTLLHAASFYDELISTYSSEEDMLPDRDVKYIFAYVLDLTIEKEKTIKEYAKQQGLEVVFSSIPTHQKSLSPVSWLAYLRSSEMVITDSFHGTVFSFIYRCPCICLQNDIRGNDRFSSLFRVLGIETVTYKRELKGSLLATDMWCDNLIQSLIQKSRNGLFLNIL